MKAAKHALMLRATKHARRNVASGLDFPRLWMPGKWVFGAIAFGAVAWAFATIVWVNS